MSMYLPIRLPILIFLASAACTPVTAAGPASTMDGLPTESEDGRGSAREIPLYEAAWKTALLPAWNSFETDERGLGYLQAFADGLAVAGIATSFAIGEPFHPGDIGPVILLGSLGLAWINRLVSMPVNILSTIQYNGEIRAIRSRPTPPTLALRMARPGTLRHFGFGLGAGNVDGFADEHAYWAASFTVRGERFAFTAHGRMETPFYPVPGRFRAEAEERSDICLIPEYIHPLANPWFAKAGLGFSRTDFMMYNYIEDGDGAPEWDVVWRVEPTLTVGRSFLDNKLSLEASLGLTAWDSRFAAPREQDAIPFGWGTPVEPGFRFAYWL